ncbi:MAG: UvrD-helicase domain-containing protein [Firmicutes bacterium]|nr:UvrD-helicase domain-containing protein [Bacillota bacterium]
MKNNPEFTTSQLRAIEVENTNVLVSAGAGSGKTAVLTERVIRKLLQGVDIDQLIILTFTNAAAAEMKHRIKERIQKHSELVSQISRLDNAIISTFDSFALRIVKTYGYLLNVHSQVTISDSVLLNQAKDLALNHAIEKAYSNPSKAFSNTIDLYFDKGDQLFIEAVKTLIAGIELIPEPMKYLDRYEQTYYSQEFFTEVLSDLVQSIRQKTKDLSIYLSYFKSQFENSNPEKTDPYFTSIDSAFVNILQAKNLDEMLILWLQFSYPTKPRSKADDGIDHQQFSAYHERLKKDVKSIQSSIDCLKSKTSDEILSSISSVSEPASVIIQIAKDYLIHKELMMKDQRLFGFSEMMNLAIELFEKHPEIRDEFISKIDEIMVDEYQDTSDVQERLLMILENDNLFMVGDLKQSIYGFRNANPDNFYRKYLEYQKGTSGVLIELVENFRSRKEILSGINQLFLPLMDQDIGGIDYQNNQSLRYGNKTYDLFDSITGEIEILTYSKSKEIEENPAFHSGLHETKLILSDIVKKISSGLEIVDLKGETKRKASYGDFAILCDRQSSFDMIEKEFMKNDIPILKVSDDVFSMSMEIQVLHLFIRLVSCFRDESSFNQYFRSAVFGLARSFLYQFEDETIIDFTLSLSGNYKTDMELLKNHPVLSVIHEHGYKTFLELGNEPIYQWLLRVLHVLDYYRKISLLANPRFSEMRLDFLMEKIKTADFFDFDDLKEYLEFVYDSKDTDIEYARNIDFSENKVKLMTMHKSKGLEFPITYYTGLSKKFNFKEQMSPFIFKPDYGLILKPFNGEFYETALHYLAKENSKIKDRSERLRLFYVALTRSKEHLILVANKDEFEDSTPMVDQKGVVLKSERLSVQSFTGFLRNVAFARSWFKEGVVSLKMVDKVVNQLNSIEKYEYKSFDFPIQEPKFTRLSKHEMKRLDNDTSQKLKAGKLIHQVFECFDFFDIEKSYHLLSDEYKKYIQLFLQQFGDRIKLSKEIYQETEFYDMQDQKEVHGFIDFFAILEKEVLLIDYKLKSIEDPEYEHQVSGYRKYLEKVTQKPVHAYLYSLLTGEIKEMS